MSISLNAVNGSSPPPRHVDCGTRGSRPVPRGFSLVEMLVVIGIISVLVTFLFPLVGKVRETGRVTGCLANVRAIYSAFVEFELANGRLPRPPKVGEGRSPEVLKWAAWPQPSTGIADYDAGPLWKYLGSTKDARFAVLNCPSDLSEQTHLGGYSDVSRNHSYSFNARIRDEASGYPTIRLGDVLRPAEKIMIWEEIAPNDGYCLDPIVGNRWDDQPSGRHGGGALNRSDNPNPSVKSRYRTAGKGCFGYFDGHVDSVSPEMIFQNPKCYAPLRTD